MSNRDRLIKLIEIFHAETDEEHDLSLKNLQEQLEEILREHVSIGSIMADINYLREQPDRNVYENTYAHGEKRYSMPQTEFETHELRILVDAIASARSITPDLTRKLIQKITSFTSDHIAKKLENQLFIDEHVKASSELLKFYIYDIHQAISEQLKIKFQYRKYTLNKNRELLHKGQTYMLAPYGLIWSNDYYYVIGEQEGFPGEKTFRIDRMTNVSITNKKFRKPDFNVVRYLNQTFNMYPGPIELVEIQFDNHLINVVIDRFGENVRLSPVNEKTFKIRVEAAISDGLVRWLLTWGGDAKVLSPKKLVERMKMECEKLMQQYME